MDEFESALEEAQALMDEEGVDAVGEGEDDGRRVIDVWVRPDAVPTGLPAEIRGVPVRVRSSGGEIRALDEDI